MIGEAPITMASPRISFSTDFVDDDSFISISPGSSIDDKDDLDPERSNIMKNNGLEFEFLSSKNSFDASQSSTMLTADELIFQGKLLPYCKINHASDENLTKINLKASSDENNNNDDNNNPVCPNETSSDEVNNNENPQEIIPPKKVNNGMSTTASGILLGREPQEPRIWFVDDDPSPRPPKCTVLWKELLRLKKQKPSTIPPSSSSSSSLSDASVKDEAIQKEKEKHIKKIKKDGLERTRSSNSIKIRPMFNVPISTQTSTKSSSLPPLFPPRNNKIDR